MWLSYGIIWHENIEKAHNSYMFHPKYQAQKFGPPALTHLDNVVVYVFGITVDQVDLFSVDILHRLLVQTVVVHVFVVGFVYVPLFSDER